MTMNRHESFQELISASLNGDLTVTERQRLDSHLDSCSYCRDTLAAFSEQRRIMSGLRHVGPPRDLGARVRAGIERGRFKPTPWWRRPAVMFTGIGGSLTAVAGALLAIVLLNGDAAESEVGQIRPSPSVTITAPSETARPTLAPVSSSPMPSASVSASVSATASPPSAAPSATVSPVEEAPEPDVVMAVDGPFDALAFSVVETPTREEVTIEETAGSDVDEPMAPTGPPIVAELSSDGQWLAFITEGGGSGFNAVWATRLTDAPEPTDPDATPPIDSIVAVGETVHLGESVAGSPFLERMSWSSDGGYLAYTLANPETDEPDADVWIFESASGKRRQLTDVGNAYAASFVPSTDEVTANLWVSLAGNEPRSFVMGLRSDVEITPGDPAELGTAADDVFQPLLSPSGSLAIFWRGRMAQDPDLGWTFVEDGAPYLAEHDLGSEPSAFGNERQVFSDLPTEGALFGSAAMTWGLDGDAYAIWDTTWTGDIEEGGEPYPDAARVYFGHATDARGLTRQHAIDRGDVGAELMIVDVEVAPTGGHLLITVRERQGGVMEAPRAELRLITRNVGDVADEVDILDVADDGWVGPAVFRADAQPDWDPALAP
ncbi:MAG: zf-HC2 domain-containing protein [Candidatus Limnocylindria bacterium]